MGDEGGIIKGGSREAVRRGLETDNNCVDGWGLWKGGNGDVCDRDSIYGEQDIVYRRLVDGVAVPVEEGFVLIVERGRGF